ncbi:hypothetical protein LMG667_03390 [Xanthomonas euvesicatoria]|uniref:hypothetical protein n=1 Tax=Xanthomonas euvesicatoria TaxID=456327 RepID=UPI00080E0056|nr:hypothetical protein [Xanthomonas euvesicatoria]OCG90028.1 hypothetical protein LMG667_03390 [Xanthomonas euvesicatoria]
MGNELFIIDGVQAPQVSALSELANAGDHFLKGRDDAALKEICGVSTMDHAGEGWTGVIINATEDADEDLVFPNIDALWVTYAEDPSHPDAHYALAMLEGELTPWAARLESDMGPYSGEEERSHAAQLQQERDWQDQQPVYDPPLFGYFIDLDERGSFLADVRDELGNTVFEIRAGNELADDESSIFDDGFMRDKHDLSGLQEHLVSLGILEKDHRLLASSDFERELEARSEQDVEDEDEEAMGMRP